MSGYRNLLVGGAIVSALVFGSGAVYAEGDLKAKAIVQSQETAGSQEMRLEDIIKDESAADSFRKSGGTLEEALKFEDIRRDGKRVISDWQIALLWKYGCKPEEASKLAGLEDGFGNPIFYGPEMVWFKKWYGTFEYAEALTKLKDKDGTTLFYGAEIASFRQYGGTVYYAQRLAELKDKYRYNIFKGGGIIQFEKIGGTIEFAEGLAKLRDKDMEQIFQERDIINLWEERGTVRFAEDMASFVDKDVDTIFDGDHITRFRKLRGTVEYARSLLKIEDEDGKQIFDAWGIILLKENGGTVSYAQELAKHKDKNGYNIFHGGGIAGFKEFGGTVEEAKEFVDIKDDEGNPAFPIKDILRLKRHRVTAQYARELAGLPDENGNRRFDNFTIYRLAQLGLSLDEVLHFKDTERPNAVVIYPSSDWNETFEDQKAIDFFKTIRKEYDVWVRIASREEQVYEAITNVPDAELLVLAGHGIKTSLGLGENDLAVEEAEKDETYMIDLFDDEFEAYLAKLSPDAVIFMYSCLTAEGGKGAENLANKVIGMAGGRRLIAAICSISNKSVRVRSVYPFDAGLVNPDTGNDCTYSNK